MHGDSFCRYLWRYSYVLHKYYGTHLQSQPTLISRRSFYKNQISLCETIVNVTTFKSLPHEPTPPMSLVSTTKSTDSFNPTPISLQPLQCAMCGQRKSSYPSECHNYGVTCSACGVVGHNMIFCRKVIALKKSTSNPSRGNNNERKKDNNQKKKRISVDTSSSEEENPIKTPKRLIWQRMSTCLESPQNLLILSRTLTFHPFRWPNLPKKHPTFFPCSRMFRERFFSFCSRLYSKFKSSSKIL